MFTPQVDQHQSPGPERTRNILRHTLRLSTDAHAGAPHRALKRLPVAIVVTAATFTALGRLRRMRETIERLRYDATHDHLTGLLNRNMAIAHLTQAAASRTSRPSPSWLRRFGMAPSAERPRVGMVGLLDLDAFKAVNDEHGHAAGDCYLTALAHRLRDALGEDGTVYRLAGDEFLIIWTRTPANPLLSAGRIMAALSRPLDIDGQRFRPAASLGLALPGPHLRGTDLIAAADPAMYATKRHPDRSGQTHGAAGLYTAARPPASPSRRHTSRSSSAATHQRQRNASTVELFEPVRPAATSRGTHVTYIETVHELIQALSAHDPASPVMSALQPSYPMTGLILKTAQTRDGVVWIVTDTADYLPNEAREALGW